MGILRRLGTILGFLKDEPHNADEDDDDRPAESLPRRPAESLPRRPARGFSVQVPPPAAAADDKHAVGSIIVPCNLGEGGVQGFRWYASRLRIDEDGDVAHEFLDEVPDATSFGLQEHSPRFEVKYNTRPAPVRKQAIAINGNVHPSMEYKGMLHWV